MPLANKPFEDTVGKGEIARNDLLYPQCFLPIKRTFWYFHQILNCRLQTVSIWKGLKSVIWKRVKGRYQRTFWPVKDVHKYFKCINPSLSTVKKFYAMLR